MEFVDEIPNGCGPIGLLSGEEFLPAAMPFDEALLAETGRRIALLLSADPRAAHQSARLAQEHFTRLGAETSVVDVFRREDATGERVPSFDVLYIGGGSPTDLLACIRDTPLWHEVLKRWRSGAGLAGSSAGAMVLCRHCLEPESGAFVPEHWATGLGPIEGFAVAEKFDLDVAHVAF